MQQMKWTFAVRLAAAAPNHQPSLPVPARSMKRFWSVVLLVTCALTHALPAVT